MWGRRQELQEQTGEGKEPYLVDIDQDREGEAVKRLFSLLQITLYNPLPDHNLISDLGFSWPNWWAILEIPVSVLAGGEGEIDAFFGSLTEWPPKRGPLAAIEAKAARVLFNRKGKMTLVSTRAWHKNRKKLVEKQLPRLVSLDLDRVALLDIIAASPSTSNTSGQAWIEAAAVGSAGIDAAIRTIERSDEKLPYDFIGHWILGWGSVTGGSELWRGAPGLFPLHRSSDNPSVDDPEVAPQKTKVQNRVIKLLSGLAWPQVNPPLVTRYCRICRSLHRLYFGGGEDPCRREH